MSSSTAREEAKRNRILAGARTVFIARGLHGATTDAIAAAAGVSKQTLYACYPGKEALLLAVLEREMAPARSERLPRVRTIGGLERALLGFARALIDTMADPETQVLLRILLGEVANEDLRRSLRRLLPLPLLERVRTLLADARARGLIDAADPDIPARMFVGAVMSFAMVDGVLSGGPLAPPDEKTLRHLVDLVLRVLQGEATPARDLRPPNADSRTIGGRVRRGPRDSPQKRGV